MSAAGAAAVIAAVENEFKRYLIVCEYLQIDPAALHSEEAVKKRADEFLSSVTDLDEKTLKRVFKDVLWFKSRYKKLVGLSYKFAKRSAKLIVKGGLTVFPETVSDTFVWKGLSRKNFEFYNEKQKKLALIAIGAVGAIISVVLLLIVIL